MQAFFLDKILEKYDRIALQNTSTRSFVHERDFNFCKALLYLGEENPEKIYNQINKLARGAYRGFNVLENLRILGLDHPALRKKWVKNIKDDERKFSEFFYLRSKIDEKKFLELSENLLFPKYFRTRMREKAILTEFCRRIPFREKDKFERIVKKLSYSASFYLLKDILFAKAGSLGTLSKNSDIRQKMGATSRGLMNSANENHISGFKDSEDELSHLREENEDLKTAQFMTAKELEEFQNNFEEIKKEMEEQVVKDFFSKLNSQFYGSLLDQFLKSELQLKKLKDSGYTFPQEVESIPMSIRMFNKFLRDYGIETIDVQGRQFVTNLEGSAFYEYAGSPFEDSGVSKNVWVSSPGWKYENVTISFPKIFEVSDNQDESVEKGELNV